MLSAFLIALCVGASLAPLFAISSTRTKGLSSIPTSYHIQGRIILSTVNDGFQRVFRFFNEVGGTVSLAKKQGAIEAEGQVQVRLPDNFNVNPKKGTKVMMERIHHLGATPVATITIENLTGLRDNEITVGHVGTGTLTGKIRVLGVVEDLNVPVKITHYAKETYIVEPKEGITYSMEELGVTGEIAYLMGADMYGIEDLLRLYFKLVLETEHLSAK